MEIFSILFSILYVLSTIECMGNSGSQPETPTNQEQAVKPEVKPEGTGDQNGQLTSQRYDNNRFERPVQNSKVPRGSYSRRG
ncbi:hypothetical protein CWI37_0671p0010 [Hamiltosporidium tvaerminnensis]|nr:hypothetical protein CWI37_0671p0010 [Hamiltosporidium tvaerminnensis]